ncbi:cytochrome ubiquinol oxidase subunit I [Caulobacter sp. CCUG 60055]|uniref:cytochrome ubiquinol oxidase subunit I n=1 Tax=Caulobacter sp. CCUG 60055 TaxID=2100090 RepID=UPI001FA79FF8|nr:cytochrome ubiquinol oxidase subunit I [Caulobacter sp. CCUG 60055]MBQ1542976.1 cytochrome ubiquinol oxidase subunit I [Caulobacteraceae bacterium]MCI3180120.1 cytochrome ubiquinol oxidase subunit I [Caulobacter sp. CCUG 60055]
MDLEALLLARLQFAFTIGWHIIFPSFTIGLASFLAVLEGAWLVTKRDVFKTLYLFWVKIFALSFGMGVVSGVVMSYQFGANWSVFATQTGPVLGPLLGFEVLTAFFLEASFLGVMLFGWKKVGPGLHFAATALVAGGTLVSAFWILSANSWMQFPTGFGHDASGRMVALDWLQVIFSPTFPSRFAHMVLAAYLTTSLVVGAASAWALLKRPDQPESRLALRMAIGMFAVVAPLQLVVGDISGDVAARYQPSKLAAIEAFWETKAGQAFHIVAWPDRQAETNRWEVSIPKLGSLIVAKDANAEVKGLKAFAKEDRPPVGLVFWAFRVMVGLGLLMIALGFWGAWLWWRGGGPERSRTYLRFAVAMGPAGFVAVIAGWMVAEIGRQPWVVFGVMRTASAASPVHAGTVSASLLMFLAVYAIVFSVGALYILRLIAQGPAAVAAEPALAGPRAPGSALAAAPDADAGLVSRESDR